MLTYRQVVILLQKTDSPDEFIDLCAEESVEFADHIELIKHMYQKISSLRDDIKILEQEARL